MPVAVASVLPFLAKPPSVDEESYLWIAARLDPLRPYDWTRIWQPFDADAFVFAHPPLFLWWMALFQGLQEQLWLHRALAGLPFVALYAWSVARLAARCCQHPHLAAVAWITSATVLLGLQNTLMIDLPVAALMTFAVAAYREGLEGNRRWFPVSGVALGLACATKYPALGLFLVLCGHMARQGWRWEVWALAGGIAVAVEGFLAATYGRLHLWEVWSRRSEIAAGPLDGRWAGTLVRLALLPMSLAVARASPVLAMGAVGLAFASLAWLRPAEIDATDVGVLVVFAILGALALARGVAACFAPHDRRRKGDHDDALLLGAWVVVTVLGVVLVHRYASARYLLPASAPLAILVTRSAEEVPGGKALLKIGATIAGTIAVAVCGADFRFARASVQVAEAADRLVRDEGGVPGRFAGEWGFRYAMERAGWTRYRPDEPLPSGTWVAVADHSSPGAVDRNRLEPMRRLESDDRFPVRVVDAAAGIGLYAETLGVLPLGVGEGPLEGVTLHVVKPETP